ncbi:hypothetical protein DFH28DRAFT_946012, partial [Melampsora americana]
MIDFNILFINIKLFKLQTINICYGVQYHLMACSWNPQTCNPKAHWENEPHHTIKAEKPKVVEKKTPQSSDLIKMRLTSTLNGLVSKYLIIDICLPIHDTKAASIPLSCSSEASLDNAG